VKEGLAGPPGPKRGGEIVARGFAALAEPPKNGYIRFNLWFSYDRVLRVGPTGPALFYYLSALGADNDPRVPFGQLSRVAARLQPNAS
jgi:hypothetical protein